ncbi:S-locus glycoprotein family protein [Arabidopsis thaliana]|uniref:S-locus glycoprotein family protein n=1 Tax=Arabidopsis thaliana TaxID=3702 RepID=A0A1P8AWX0_ARATH|nr:S-locus glycoprotein family protein [Arabidopsis thaliana]ANM61154.1 S-locus glycoprotein family protein [Arabidopsis thaliana]|eukprot:NP_001323389.1 S-locus glycoprotein family protein [Arabidopsis thaliana]
MDWNERNARIDRSFKGFKPKNPAKWNEKDRPGGCVRNTHLNCKTDEFLKLSMLKLPRSGSAISIKGMWFDPCRDYCLKNCKCQAFALPVGPATLRNSSGGTKQLRIGIGYGQCQRRYVMNYSECGSNAYCNPITNLICNYFKGFKPKNPAKWNEKDRRGGCVRDTRLN